ncbi:MAG: hypothetical protein N2235_14835 [Fischerella sp.]|nr:hypothetical protein [Fischerella sp.]
MPASIGAIWRSPPRYFPTVIPILYNLPTDRNPTSGRPHVLTSFL